MDMQSSMVMSTASGSMGSMAMGTATAMSSAMPTASAAMSSSIDMGMGPGACKISMLWNWNTIDACFISSSWHITSKSMFAGSCIGVILLVCALELLRRLGREYDRYIVLTALGKTRASPSSKFIIESGVDSKTATTSRVEGAASSDESGSSDGSDRRRFFLPTMGKRASLARPTLPQQMVRAVLHMLQFGVAYFVMLLAMYYNGYFIICILLGALIGAFAFSWDLAMPGEERAGGCCGE